MPKRAKKQKSLFETSLVAEENGQDKGEAGTTSEKLLGVSDFLDYVNQILKVVDDVKVLGEISRLSPHPTGVYMTLKDKTGDGVLDCYINPYTYRGLGLILEEGMEVKVSGVPGIFKRRSQLSFKVEGVELAGEGTLKKAYELLKLKLEQEGLFDRKRDLPEFISRIGVITSKTGAVIGDFRNNLGQQGYKLYFKDCRVEGAQSAPQIIDAIKYFNERHPDLDCLVIMRGGGSLEDLQAFNNEQVVKEIFASRIPTIAAIGHDRDVPLACLVADRYTSTPTAAAVLVNSSWQTLKTGLPNLQSQLLHGYQLALEDYRANITSLTHRLTNNFKQIFDRYRYLTEKIVRGMSNILSTITATVTTAEKLLYTSDPARNLKLGYSLVYNEQGGILRDSSKAKTGDKLRLKLHKGDIDTQVINSN